MTTLLSGLPTTALEQVKNYLLSLQSHICIALEKEDGKSNFNEDRWEKENGGGGLTRLLVNGNVFEKAGVGFSHVYGETLPPAATVSRPELVGRHFNALGVSLVLHPINPYVPTTHANIRFFIAEDQKNVPIWWFGGGFDLTPYYGFEEDCYHWHSIAKKACLPFGKMLYPRLKQACDEYFYIKHRQEARGIGGLFFDDFNELGFQDSFAFIQSVGNHFLSAYLPIVNRRKMMPYSAREKSFQLYRRGRYVEFNLVYDRGTLFGLQTGGRIESILMSLPPEVHWHYNWQPETGSPESALNTFLTPRDWL